MPNRVNTWRRAQFTTLPPNGLNMAKIILNYVHYDDAGGDALVADASTFRAFLVFIR